MWQKPSKQQQLKLPPLHSTNLKKKVTTYPMPIFIKKNSTSLKLQSPLLTNLKKEKVFSFLLDLIGVTH
jgi:hypothetical protein